MKQPLKKSTITIDVQTDENNLTEAIQWAASDSKAESEKAKALILALWDEEGKSAVRIDLWEKKMTVGEMKLFFYQTLLTMADTFEKSTSEKNMAEDLRDYCAHFAEKMDIHPPSN